MNLRMKAESSAASAEEEVGILKEKLSRLSESTGRGRSCLDSEIEQLKRDSKLSATRISAEVSGAYGLVESPALSHLPHVI